MEQIKIIELDITKIIWKAAVILYLAPTYQTYYAILFWHFLGEKKSGSS